MIIEEVGEAKDHIALPPGHLTRVSSVALLLAYLPGVARTLHGVYISCQAPFRFRPHFTFHSVPCHSGGLILGIPSFDINE